MKPRIIGLYSDAPGSGKTEVAKALNCLGYFQLSFATPLKEIAVAFLMQLGYSRDQAIYFVNFEKQYHIKEVGVTVRKLLQTLGTEWGREQINQDVWIQLWEKRVQYCNFAVADDIRFVNEAQKIRSLGGQIWKVSRPDATVQEAHASEGGLSTWPDFDVIINNGGTLEQLKQKVTSIFD